MRLSVTSNPRVRFSVECAFPHLGKRGAGSRKSALCSDGLTEKRTLRSSPIGKTQFGVASYGKVHSVGLGGCRLRFSVTSPPGRRGTKPPASLRGTMENGPTGQMRSGNPPPGCGGGCAGDPQALAWGLDARKGAVWAEGLAEGTPWAKPGHHQAAGRS